MVQFRDLFNLYVCNLMSNCNTCHVIANNISTIVTILTLLKTSHKLFTQALKRKAKGLLQILKTNKQKDKTLA